MAKLILVRHGQSEWNALGQWTGKTDIGLTEEGKAQARTAGQFLKDIHIDRVYVSSLIRTVQTLHEIESVLGKNFEAIATHAIDERDYGIYTGKNKWEVEKEFGADRFQALRRSWDYPVEGGETLKVVSERVVPYFEEHIKPELLAGKNVLVSSHGNTLRTLIKYLEGIDDAGVEQVEIEIAQIYIYEIDEHGKIANKHVLGGKAGADKPKS